MKNYILKEFGSIFLILIIIVILLLVMKGTVDALAWVSVGDFLSKGSIPMPTVVANKEIPYVEPPKQKKPVKVTTKVSKPVLNVKEVKIDTKNCTSKVRTDLVNHAYQISGGDMKFLWTISSESMWDVWAVGDGGKSIWLCQFHKGYQPDNYKAYKSLKTDFDKLEFCHEKYEIWKKKGILHRRLYGYNVWQKGLEKLEISCK